MYEMFEGENYLTLRDLLLNSVCYLKNVKIEGSTKVVAAKLEPFKANQQTTFACMKTLNLGDSGYMLLRPSLEMVFRSEPQQSRFDCPY